MPQTMQSSEPALLALSVRMPQTFLPSICMSFTHLMPAGRPAAASMACAAATAAAGVTASASSGRIRGRSSRLI